MQRHFSFLTYPFHTIPMSGFPGWAFISRSSGDAVRSERTLCQNVLGKRRFSILTTTAAVEDVEIGKNLGKFEWCPCGHH